MEAKQHSSEDAADNFVVERKLDVLSAQVRFACPPGISILTDADGAQLHAYCRAFSGQLAAERVTLRLGSRELGIGDLSRVGFDEELPQELTVSALLRKFGVKETELAATLEMYDLRKVGSFTCGALSATAVRQLQLLTALYADHPLIVLNDPFQPFNGRWREHFAQGLLDTVEKGARRIIVVNLSFTPKCWEKHPRVRCIDVCALATEAIEKTLLAHRQEKELEEAARKAAEEAAAKEKKLLAELQGEKDHKAEAVKNNESGEPMQLPAPLMLVYTPIRDYIFEPLAELSNKLRAYGLVTVMLSMAALITVLAVMLFPNLADKRALIARLAESTESWTNLQQLFNAEEPKEVNTTAEKMVETLPTSDTAVVADLALEKSALFEVPSESLNQQVRTVGEEAIDVETEAKEQVTDIKHLSDFMLNFGTVGLVCSLNHEHPEESLQ